MLVVLKARELVEDMGVIVWPMEERQRTTFHRCWNLLKQLVYRAIFALHPQLEVRFHQDEGKDVQDRRQHQIR